jgi:hypothetical protein
MEIPVLVFNSYSGSDKSWQQLIGWSVPEGATGYLFDLMLRSSNDPKTTWRIRLAGRDMKLPTDRILTTPTTLRFYGAKVHGSNAVLVEMATKDGTQITTEATLTGALETGTP